ncbi:MAG: hypothetical protein KKE39_04355 [Bacteroidetes bacterium]|nr:hypothetical protein [Bacteroidota bacterium]MBU1372655.1 hypothetical protein [Bacteroidota bacterium]MBU1484851.1 hypothetical protein [Bacteroidota bacterium]MBU1761004.1 hypothetical protein [Bacteroidota bacterium]MBU2045867.1 hypothetical protein [Bacteroidota bacterium]
MRSLKIQFSHPVKGIIQMFTGLNHKASYSFEADSLNKDFLEVPLDRFKKGKYMLFFEWEHDGLPFLYKTAILVQ